MKMLFKYQYCYKAKQFLICTRDDLAEKSVIWWKKSDEIDDRRFSVQGFLLILSPHQNKHIEKLCERTHAQSQQKMACLFWTITQINTSDKFSCQPRTRKHALIQSIFWGMDQVSFWISNCSFPEWIIEKQKRMKSNFHQACYWQEYMYMTGFDCNMIKHNNLLFGSHLHSLWSLSQGYKKRPRHLVWFLLMSLQIWYGNLLLGPQLPHSSLSFEGRICFQPLGREITHWNG